MTREPTLGEVAEDLTELKAELRVLASRMDTNFVRADVYHVANEAVLRMVEGKLALIDARMLAATSMAEGARVIAMWALGLLVTIAIGGLVAIVSQGAT